MKIKKNENKEKHQKKLKIQMKIKKNENKEK